MTFSITSVSPSKILADGGREIVVTGVFEVGHRYRVHIGDLGTIDDPICYSGISDQGTVVYPKDSDGDGIFDQITAYSPLMNPGSSAYSVVVIDVDTLEAHVLSGLLTVLKKQFYTTVYATKNMQHPDYYLGPKRIDLEKPTT